LSTNPKNGKRTYKIEKKSEGRSKIAEVLSKFFHRYREGYKGKGGKRGLSLKIRKNAPVIFKRGGVVASMVELREKRTRDILQAGKTLALLLEQTETLNFHPYQLKKEKRHRSRGETVQNE